MTFAVAGETYDRHVGRYGRELGTGLVGATGVDRGQRALDVGAGTGALTSVLVDLLGAENVAAVEPSEPFAADLRERLPGVEVHLASAESLPFPDGEFDAVLAQLVLNFLAEPEAGLAEMRRVVRPGGVVAACVWDYPGEMTLLRAFWDAAAELEPELVAGRDERAAMVFDEEGELARFFRVQRLTAVEEGALIASAHYESFEDLWDPFTAGVGPAGAYAASLDDGRRGALREEFWRRLGSPRGQFRLTARAWYAVGNV